MIVYAIRNDLNDKVYVGQTSVSIDRRFALHRYSKRTDMPIALAMRELGAEHFRIEVLEECATQSQLNEAERTWIERLGSILPSGYNVSLGTGRHASTRAKISVALKGRAVTWGDKISASMKGREPSAAQLARLARGRARTHSDAERAARGRNNRHRKLSDADVRLIRCLCAEGNHSQEQIARRFGVRQVAVSRIARRVSYSWLPD